MGDSPAAGAPLKGCSPRGPAHGLRKGLTTGSHPSHNPNHPARGPRILKCNQGRNLPGSRRPTTWYVTILFLPPAAVGTAAGVCCLLREARSRQLNPPPHVRGLEREEPGVPHPSRCDGGTGPTGGSPPSTGDHSPVPGREPGRIRTRGEQRP